MYETNCWFQAKAKNLSETILSGSQTVSHPLKEIWPHQGWCWEEFSAVLVTSCLLPRGVGCNMSFIAVDGVFYPQSGPLVWVGGLLLAQPCVGGTSRAASQTDVCGPLSSAASPCTVDMNPTCLYPSVEHALYYVCTVLDGFSFFLNVCCYYCGGSSVRCVCVSVKIHVKRLCVAPLNYQCK